VTEPLEPSRDAAAPAATPDPLPRWRRRRGEPICSDCRLAGPLCICGLLPRLEAPIELVVIQHHRERHSQSNTGFLVGRLFANCVQIRHGSPGLSTPAALVDPAADAVVLFPRLGAPPLSPELFSSGKRHRRALVILDGSWKQARRMSQRLAGLRGLPYAALADPPAPRWRLREPRARHQLGTAEAVARALAALGHDDEAHALEAALQLLAARVLASRGKMSRLDFLRRDREAKERL
jgi:DTW domain-containing protein YfiP